jgi:hypothetical protein
MHTEEYPRGKHRGTRYSSEQQNKSTNDTFCCTTPRILASLSARSHAAITCKYSSGRGFAEKPDKLRNTISDCGAIQCQIARTAHCHMAGSGYKPLPAGNDSRHFTPIGAIAEMQLCIIQPPRPAHCCIF